MARKLMGKSSKTAESSSAPDQVLICDRCNVQMELIEASFDYLSRNFRHKVPRCPLCGQVSLPEELVTGKMADVESMIEDK